MSKNIFIVNVTSLLISTLLSCTSSVNETEKTNLLFYSHDFTIPLDASTTPYTNYAQIYYDYSTDDGELYILNSNLNAIQSYNLLTGKKSKEIFFVKEGPTSVGVIQGFHIMSNRHIYVSNRDAKKLYVTSYEGLPLRKYDMEISNKQKVMVCPIPIMGSGIDICLSKSKVIIPGNPGLVHERNAAAFFKQSFLSILLDTASTEVKYAITYPNVSLLSRNNYPPQSITPFCIAGEKDNLIYSFGCDDSVYVYNNSGKLIRKKYLHSNYSTDKIKSMASNVRYTDNEECYLYYLNNLFYGAMYYDKYREYYYRFVKLPLKEKFTKRELLDGKRFDQRWSVIVADKNLNKIEEIELSKNIWGGLALISKEGLMIQKWVEDENRMVFSVFKIKK